MSITLALGKESIDAHGKEASYSCYTPVANLFQLTTGRTNELWNVAGLVALTLSLEPIPTRAGNHFQAPSVDRLHGQLGLPFLSMLPGHVDGGSHIVS
jgi:hypothetical protein